MYLEQGLGILPVGERKRPNPFRRQSLVVMASFYESSQLGCLRREGKEHDMR